MKVRIASLATTAVLAAALCAGEAEAMIFKVTTASGLRRALRAAAANRSADTIVLAGGVYRARGVPFLYEPAVGTWVYGASYDLKIVGAGAAGTVLEGGRLSRVLEVRTRGVGLAMELRALGVRQGAAGGDPGGGLLFQGSDSARLTLTRCVFSDNAAAAGGAVHATGSLAVERSKFLRNRADTTGGGINYPTDSYYTSRISGSLFDGNTAADGGGAFISGSFSMGGNTFVRNVATARGGGASLNGYTTVRGNRFLANAADEGGGLWADWYGQTIESNVFAGNTARRGGGGAITYSQFLGLNSNTVTGNSAISEGGGLAITPQRSSILQTDRYRSNILWGNSAPGAGADLLLDDLIVGNNPRTILLTTNLVGSFLSRCGAAEPSVGCIPDIAVEDAVSGPPGFVQQSGDDPTTWDLRLAAGSPCIDTGFVPAFNGGGNDIEGIERPLDGDGDGVALPDVGAAERYLKPVLIDPNATGNPIASGSIYRVRWAAPPDVAAFAVHFSADGGRRWRRAAPTRVAARSLAWEVPRPTANLTACRIKVTGYYADGSAAGADVSNWDFRIEVVGLTMPNDTCRAGERCVISWKTHGTARPVAQVRLQYQFLGDPTVRTIALVPGNPGVWNWTAPPPAQCAGSFANVMVTLLDGAGASLGTDSREIQLQR